MNTLSDLIEFDRERASRHIGKSDDGWWIAGMAVVLVFLLCAVLASFASAI